MFKSLLVVALIGLSFTKAAFAEDPLDKIAPLCDYDKVVYYGESDRAGNSYYLLCKTPKGIEFTYGAADTLQIQGHRFIPEKDITPIIGHNSADRSTVIQFVAEHSMVKIGETNHGEDYSDELPPINAVLSYTDGRLTGKTLLVRRSIINGIRQFYDDQY